MAETGAGVKGEDGKPGRVELLGSSLVDLAGSSLLDLVGSDLVELVRSNLVELFWSDFSSSSHVTVVMLGSGSGSEVVSQLSPLVLVAVQAETPPDAQLSHNQYCCLHQYLA